VFHAQHAAEVVLGGFHHTHGFVPSIQRKIARTNLSLMAATTRERLLEAAIEVIERQGESAVKVRDIAAKADVTEPSIYHYFGSRNGLIEEAQALRFGQGQLLLLEQFTEQLALCRTRTEFLNLVRRSFEAMFDPSASARRFTRINVLGSAETRPELALRLAAQQRETNRMVGDALRSAQARGFMRSNVDCDILAAWILGMVTGRLFIEIDPELTDSQEWNSLAIDTVLAALGSPPPSLTKWNTPTRR
jgi:AcrR family transcriptional regulator